MEPTSLSRDPVASSGTVKILQTSLVVLLLTVSPWQSRIGALCLQLHKIPVTNTKGTAKETESPDLVCHPGSGNLGYQDTLIN